MARRDRALGPVGAEGHLGPLAVGLDPGHLVQYGDLGSRRPGRVGERVGQRAHAPHRHVPVPGPAADHVVEEAAVLEQRGVMGVGEGADQGVGQHHSPYEIVGEPLLDRHADGLLEEGPPRRLVVDTRAQGLAGGQRLGEGREDALGDAARHRVEVLPGLVLPVPAGETGEGIPGAVGADEEAAGALGGVGGDGAFADGEAQPQVAHDLVGEQ